MRLKLGVFALVLIVIITLGTINTSKQVTSQADLRNKTSQQQLTDEERNTNQSTSSGDIKSADISKFIDGVTKSGIGSAITESDTVKSIIEKLDAEKILENQDIVENFCPQYKSQNVTSYIKSPSDLEAQFGDKAEGYYSLLQLLDKTCEDNKVSVEESLLLLEKTKDLDIDLSQFGL
jgi:mannitol-specific phosphotransferase system IIBC component